MKSVAERTEIAEKHGLTFEQYDEMTNKIVVIFYAIRDNDGIKQSEVYRLISLAAETHYQAAMMATALILMCKRSPREVDEGNIREYFWEVDS